jgi:hypothetical protein
MQGGAARKKGMFDTGQKRAKPYNFVRGPSLDTSTDINDIIVTLNRLLFTYS